MTFSISTTRSSYCTSLLCNHYPQLSSKSSEQPPLQGLSEIENLEEYTDLKCLWLENNCIKTIKGLDHLSLLKCLFLHHNRIEQITVT